MKSIIVFIFLIVLPWQAMGEIRYGDMLCHTQQQAYSCFKVPRGESWESLFPNDNQRASVMRINRMDIRLSPGMVIAIPADLENIDYMKFSPFEHQIQAPGEKEIIVDPKVLAYGAYDEKGDLVRWGPVAVGRDYCPDMGSRCRTKTGTFHVYAKGSEDCISSKFPIPDGGAPMPYCMYFNGGYALHASDEVPGFAASHGCVRMFFEDAQWLSKEFVQKGTTVIIRPYET